MVLPLGGYGTLSIGATERAAFDDLDLSVANLLAAIATTAVERVHRRQELRHYEAVVRSVEGMACVVDGGQFSLVTEPFAAFVGYDRETLVGRPVADVLADGARETWAERVAGLAAETETATFESTVVRADGRARPVEFDVSPLRGDGQDEVVAVVRDIAELVENAVEHADDPARVHVSAAPAGDAVEHSSTSPGSHTRQDAVEIRVADEGPGIPTPEWETVVGDSDITQLSHGTGLGLWLVRWIVATADGEIRLGDGGRRHRAAVDGGGDRRTGGVTGAVTAAGARAVRPGRRRARRRHRGRPRRRGATGATGARSSGTAVTRATRRRVARAASRVRRGRST